jgi:hypothetical protein
MLRQLSHQNIVQYYGSELVSSMMHLITIPFECPAATKFLLCNIAYVVCQATTVAYSLLICLFSLNFFLTIAPIKSFHAKKKICCLWYQTNVHKLST